MISLALSSVEIPLFAGMDQTGYIARFGGALGVLDRPRIKLLLLKEGTDKPVALFFCDLLGLSPEDTKRLEKRLAPLCGTVPERVVITCTHTHAGPASMSLLLLGETRDSWFSRFEQALCDCAEGAREFETVHVFFGKTEVQGVSRNRVRNSLLASDVDTDETVLLFKTASRRVALVNYACHPVTLPADNRLYSRDYPGVLEEELLRDGCVDEVIFATAPCGDLNPVEQDAPGEDTRRRAYGTRLATAAAELIRQGSLMELSGLSCEKFTVRLPLCTDHARANTALCLREAKRAYQQETDPVKKKYQEANYLYALVRQMLERYALSETHFDAVLTRVSFGPFSLLGVPFELFSGIGIHLKERFAPACVMELCGGNFGYFPADDLWNEAAYERGDAYMYYCRGGPLPRTSEARLVEAFEHPFLFS